MATSGTALYTVSSTVIINRALQDVGALPQGQSANASDLTDCLTALNMIIKNLQTEGFQLWTYQTISFPLVAGQITYTIAESAANITNFRPLRLMQAWVRDQSSPPNDRPLIVCPRYDYDLLTPKTTTGLAVNIYYDPQIGTGTFYVWPAPVDSSLTCFCLVQRPIQDQTLTSDFDFPQEYYQPLRYLLGADVGPSYGCPERTQQRLDQKAEYYKNRIVDWQTAEEPSVTFMPNFQLGMNYGATR